MYFTSLFILIALYLVLVLLESHFSVGQATDEVR
jgi:hypothetical protein